LKVNKRDSSHAPKPEGNVKQPGDVHRELVGRYHGTAHDAIEGGKESVYRMACRIIAIEENYQASAELKGNHHVQTRKQVLVEVGIKGPTENCEADFQRDCQGDDGHTKHDQKSSQEKCRRRYPSILQLQHMSLINGARLEKKWLEDKYGRNTEPNTHVHEL